MAMAAAPPFGIGQIVQRLASIGSIEMSGGPGDTKICASCGREMVWRKRWAKTWNEVRYCSDRCRSRKVKTVDHELEGAILELLDQRAGGATICPSEAAKMVGDAEWRSLMEPTRSAARRLVASGEIVMTQGGSIVDPSTAKGAIRIRRA